MQTSLRRLIGWALVAISLTLIFLLWCAGLFAGRFTELRTTANGVPEFYEIDWWPWWLVRLLLALLVPAMCGAILIMFPRGGTKDG
jgi:hypothetical protein